jgi:hypothetical protein
MSGNLYYVIYFVGGQEQALADWFSGNNTINKTGPFSNKLEAINETLSGYNRACIVYHAGNQICLHTKQGYVARAIPDLIKWSKTNIPVINTVVKNDLMIESQEEQRHWAFSKIKNISHEVDYSEFKLGMKNIIKLVRGSISAMIGDVPGILNVVSGLTIDICQGHDNKKEGEAWIDNITDNDGNKGLIIFKALTETSTETTFWRRTTKKMYISGIISILVPLTASAQSKCNNIRNQHADSCLTQIEKEFNFKPLNH